MHDDPYPDEQNTDLILERPDGGNYQFLGLQGANLVATDAVLVTKENLDITISQRGMMCLHGESGVGKTLAVKAGLRHRLSIETLHIEFRSHPTPRDIRGNLFRALGFSGNSPKHPLEYDQLLKAALG
ncbi:ATP-binding protein [Nonomuraea soli]|uniref:Cdc6-like AAA superfamily ATPase n=1 Tax=Nonomuraea soli TaxID=1032476 RepID=A0A7W0HW18_9ACTN|nr:ATP-binding protein [Nonomuraea soli]MBA2897804.1 Cdc6-like AAA superfamily ATPase [Nonomuraea soli]